MTVTEACTNLADGQLLRALNRPNSNPEHGRTRAQPGQNAGLSQGMHVPRALRVLWQLLGMLLGSITELSTAATGGLRMCGRDTVSRR